MIAFTFAKVPIMDISQSSRPSLPYFAQFLLLIGLVLLLGSIFTYVGAFLAKILFGFDDLTEFMGSKELQAKYPNAMLIMQSFGAIGAFFIPPFVLALILSRKPMELYDLRSKTKWELAVLATIIVFFAQPFIQLTGELNEMLSLPKSLDWLVKQDAEIQKEYESMLDIKNLSGFLVVLFVVAVLPAIGEELIFRGGLQKILHKWTGNLHAGVWIAAFLFSAVHFQIFYFLPRLVLGATFGYLFAWSKNLWYPIIAHFLNNAMVILMAYLIVRRGDTLDLNEAGNVSYPFALIASILFFVLVFLFYKITRSRIQVYDQ